MKRIALTYDDGPGPDTAELVEFLESSGVPATFFLQGTSCEEMPEVVKVMSMKSGITVATHSHTHPDLRATSDDQIRFELERSLQIAEELSGVRPRHFRPPYGGRNGNVDKVAESLGQSVVLWTLNSYDWRDGRNAAAHVVRHGTGGDVVLLHDTKPNALKTTKDIVMGLRERGFEFVSVEEIVGPTQPGVVYRGAPPRWVVVARWLGGAARTLRQRGPSVVLRKMRRLMGSA